MTKSITPFDVVLVPFPFSNLEPGKRRPCLVLARADPPRLPRHFIVAMMTSHIKKRFPHDVLLHEHSEAGLPKPTLVRLFKVVAIDESLSPRRLGALSKRDRSRISAELKRILASCL